jgi:YEATS domain-containing protein 1/3
MSVKIQLEVGHSASRKTKPSKEGFTHDWELFVRGTNGCDIILFIEKVVFNLHSSFPKPKRVVKAEETRAFVLKVSIRVSK